MPIDPPRYITLFRAAAALFQMWQPGTFSPCVCGSFERPPEERIEPARTERLLTHPYALRHDNASDTFDANSVLWLSKSTGKTW